MRRPRPIPRRKGDQAGANREGRAFPVRLFAFGRTPGCPSGKDKTAGEASETGRSHRNIRLGVRGDHADLGASPVRVDRPYPQDAGRGAFCKRRDGLFKTAAREKPVMKDGVGYGKRCAFGLQRTKDLHADFLGPVLPFPRRRVAAFPVGGHDVDFDALFPPKPEYRRPEGKASCMAEANQVFRQTSSRASDTNSEKKSMRHRRVVPVLSQDAHAFTSTRRLLRSTSRTSMRVASLSKRQLVPKWNRFVGKAAASSTARSPGDDRVVSGESGASGFGAFVELVRAGAPKEWRKTVGLDENAVVLCFSTEADTDQGNYRRVVWEGVPSSE